MKRNILLVPLKQLAHLSHYVRNYFKNGSFAIAVYPYLMHPCVTRIFLFLTKVLAILAAFGGVFYLFAEHVTILFSERSITAYVHHSVLELFFPIGTVIDGKESTLSTMPQVMRAVFSYQAYLFLPLFIFSLYPMSNKHYWILNLLLALCFSLGCLLISGITSGQYSIAGLQNLGFDITIIIGNLALIFIGLDMPKSKLAKFKFYTLLLGIIGVICLSFAMNYPTIFSPIIERIAVYTIMLWEILAGFAILNFYTSKTEIK